MVSINKFLLYHNHLGITDLFNVFNVGKIIVIIIVFGVTDNLDAIMIGMSGRQLRCPTVCFVCLLLTISSCIRAAAVSVLVLFRQDDISMHSTMTNISGTKNNLLKLDNLTKLQVQREMAVCQVAVRCPRTKQITYSILLMNLIT